MCYYAEVVVVVGVANAVTEIRASPVGDDEEEILDVDVPVFVRISAALCVCTGCGLKSEAS